MRKEGADVGEEERGEVSNLALCVWLVPRSRHEIVVIRGEREGRRRDNLFYLFIRLDTN